MENFLPTLQFLVGLLIGLLLERFLPSYFSEKGKNLATKEDIGEITQEIESIKATISSRMHVSQFRYQKEFEILSDLAAKTIDLRDATTTLRPAVDFFTEDLDTRKKERYIEWQKAGAAFYYSSERNRPFYPEEIFEEVKSLEKLCHMESSRFRIYSSNPDDRNYDPKYWDQATENAEAIKAQSDKIIQAIRNRTKTWEAL